MPLRSTSWPIAPTPAYLLASADAGLRLLVSADAGQRLLVSADAGQRLLASADDGQRLLASANHGQRLRASADGRMIEATPDDGDPDDGTLRWIGNVVRLALNRPESVLAPISASG